MIILKLEIKTNYVLLLLIKIIADSVPLKEIFTEHNCHSLSSKVIINSLALESVIGKFLELGKF
jgi:hypothetical protein